MDSTVIIPGDAVALLTRTLRALQGQSSAPARKRLPAWLPDGNPITELKDLAGVLRVDERTAAFIVMESFDPPAGMLAEAKHYTRKRPRIWHDGVQRKGVMHEQDHHQTAEARQRDDQAGDGRLAGRDLGSVGKRAEGPVTRIIKHRSKPTGR